MSTGDQLDETKATSVGVLSRTLALAEQEAAAGNGKWVDASIFGKKSIQVDGTFSSLAAEVRISNAPRKPADTEDGVKLGSDITSKGFTEITMPCHWIKLKPITVSGGYVTAYLLGIAG